jgi:hypothetical protein
LPRRRDKHDRMLPSPKMEISIRTPDTPCLIFPCKIPANSLSKRRSYGALSPGGSRTPPWTCSSTASDCLRNAEGSRFHVGDFLCLPRLAVPPPHTPDRAARHPFSFYPKRSGVAWSVRCVRFYDTPSGASGCVAGRWVRTARCTRPERGGILATTRLLLARDGGQHTGPVGMPLGYQTGPAAGHDRRQYSATGDATPPWRGSLPAQRLWRAEALQRVW